MDRDRPPSIASTTPASQSSPEIGELLVYLGGGGTVTLASQLQLNDYLGDPLQVASLKDFDRSALLSALWQYYSQVRTSQEILLLVQFLLGYLGLLDLKYPEREDERDYCRRFLRQLTSMGNGHGTLWLAKAKSQSIIQVIVEKIGKLPVFAMNDLCDFLRGSLLQGPLATEISQIIVEKLIETDLENVATQVTISKVIQEYGHLILSMPFHLKLRLFKRFPQSFDYFVPSSIYYKILLIISIEIGSANYWSMDLGIGNP